MSGATPEPFAAPQAGTTEAPWVRYTLIGWRWLHAAVPGAAAGAVFAEALRKGFGAYWKACASPMPGRPSG
jgi:sulfate transport system permease protein